MPVWGADAMKMSWLFHADVLSGNAQLMVIAAVINTGGTDAESSLAIGTPARTNH